MLRETPRTAGDPALEHAAALLGRLLRGDRAHRQAGLRELVYEEPYEYGAGLEQAYRRLIAESGMLLRRR